MRRCLGCGDNVCTKLAGSSELCGNFLFDKLLKEAFGDREVVSLHMLLHVD